MTYTIFDVLQERVVLVHQWLMQAGSSLSASQFAQIWSDDVPPIGWNLWHIARFADRLQSKLSVVAEGEVGQEVWYHQGVAQRWGYNGPENSDSETPESRVDYTDEKVLHFRL